MSWLIKFAVCSGTSPFGGSLGVSRHPWLATEKGQGACYCLVQPTGPLGGSDWSDTVSAQEMAPGNVQIVGIFYDGAEPYYEGDEYATVKNIGGQAVNLSGWRLNAGDAGQDYYFPSFSMQPNQECRIYTDEYHPESCGFSFWSGSALWNNAGDCGYLYNGSGTLVSTRCYP